MDYVASAPGTVAWNLLQAGNPPGGGNGPNIENPAIDAGEYLYFGMDAYTSVDAGGPYQGLFTAGLCGCVAAFLVRTHGAAIRRITGYHKTLVENIPAGALALFNAAGANGPNPGDVNYLIRPDKANILTALPDSIQARVGQDFLAANVHTYRRGTGDNVSWVISLDGDMGEMTAAFADSRSAEQTKGFGVQSPPVLPAANAGNAGCMPCIIM